MRSLLILAFLALTGCATAYQARGLGGGFSESMITPTMYMVKFSGNAYTSADVVNKYALLRAAELTLEKGFTHFKVVGETDSSSTSPYYIPQNTTTTGTLYTPQGAMQYQQNTSSGSWGKMHKPGVVVTISMTNSPGDQVLDAAFVIRLVKAELEL